MKKVFTILFLLISTVSFAQLGIINYDSIQSKAIQADSALWIKYLENGGDTVLTIDNGKVKYSVDLATQSWVLTQIPDSVQNSNLHVEAGRLEDLASRAVSVTFLESFVNRPIGEEPQIYRVESFKGNYRRSKLLWGWADASQPTNTGFSLNIDSSEPLANVVLEYVFVEILPDWLFPDAVWDVSLTWDFDKRWGKF